jgi:hypothetical protein
MHAISAESLPKGTLPSLVLAKLTGGNQVAVHEHVHAGCDSLAQKPCHSVCRKRLILKGRFEQIRLPGIRCFWAENLSEQSVVKNPVTCYRMKVQLDNVYNRQT